MPPDTPLSNITRDSTGLVNRYPNSRMHRNQVSTACHIFRAHRAPMRLAKMKMAMMLGWENPNFLAASATAKAPAVTSSCRIRPAASCPVPKTRWIQEGFFFRDLALSGSGMMKISDSGALAASFWAKDAGPKALFRPRRPMTIFVTWVCRAKAPISAATSDPQADSMEAPSRLASRRFS